MTNSQNGSPTVSPLSPPTAQSRASDQRWSTVARLASAACGVSTGLVAMRRKGRFEVVGISGLLGPVEQLQGERVFEETMRRSGELIEVLASPDAPVSAGHPFRHYAAIALIGSNGEEYGLIAVLGTESRNLATEEREGLALLAEGVKALIERASHAHELPASLEETPEELVVRLFAHSPEPTVVYDRSLPHRVLRVLLANTAFTGHFSGTIHSGIQSPLTELLGERSDQEIIAAIMAAGIAGRPMRATIALYPHGKTVPSWMEIWGYAVSLANGRSLWIEQFHDVTERIHRQNELLLERGRLQRTLASMADAVITLDAEGRLRFMNHAAKILLDLQTLVPGEQLLKDDERLLQLRDIDTEELLSAPFVVGSHDTEPRKARALIMTRSGARRYVEYVVSDVERPQRQSDGVVVLLRDITAEEVQTRRLSFEASHDQLTGIANRRRFDQALSRALSGAKNEGKQHTLAFLDLDRFKAVNDNCGHAAGDQVLREVAQLFKGQLRSHDVIARFGGDEFALLMHDCSPKTATRVINRIRAAIAMYRWHWQGRDYTLGVSIGLAEITQYAPDAEHILREADAACYADKATHHQHERHVPTVTSEQAAPNHRVSWTR